jgi:RES domain
VSPTLDTVPAPDILFRVGRRPDVWEWRGWESAGPDGTFGHRWDDPKNNYRVLYTSCDRLGAYLEVLAWFRPDLKILAEYVNIKDNDPTAAPTNAPGRLKPLWRDGRILGRGASDGVQDPLVAGGRSASLATIHQALAGVALKHGLKDINAEMIRRTAPRRFTQEVSRLTDPSQSAS